MKCVQILTATALALAAAAAVAQQTQVAKAPSSRAQAQGEARQLAAAVTAAEATQAQLAIAQRVHVGRSDCEFDQHVSVTPLDGRPGYFKVTYKQSTYTMLPEETSTGAVRLEDKQAGMVWLQIANKSMLMNSKAGRRMADACMHAAQRAVAAAGRDPKSPSLLGSR